jgi:hypothetical protein
MQNTDISVIYILLWSFLYSSHNEYAYPENVVPKSIATTTNAFSFLPGIANNRNKRRIIDKIVGLGLTNKTPTTILFNKDGKFCSFGYEAEHDYAKMCEDSTHAEYRYFSKFKMRLYQPECGANKGNMRGKVSEFS